MKSVIPVIIAIFVALCISMLMLSDRIKALERPKPISIDRELVNEVKAIRVVWEKIWLSTEAGQREKLEEEQKEALGVGE